MNRDITECGLNRTVVNLSFPSDDLELDTFNLPAPTITSNSPICDNSPIILTGSSAYTGSLAVSFDWYQKQTDGSFSLFRTTSSDTIHLYPSNSVYKESEFAVGIRTTTNSGCSPSAISTQTYVAIEVPAPISIGTSKTYYCDEEYATEVNFNVNGLINPPPPANYSRTWEYYNPKDAQWQTLNLTGQGTCSFYRTLRLIQIQR